MSLIRKKLLGVITLVLLITTVGGGIASASSGKAPLSALIGKTRMLLPGEFMAQSSDATYQIYNSYGNEAHYLTQLGTGRERFYVYIPFPAGKTAKWVKIWLRDNDDTAGNKGCITVVMSNQKIGEANSQVANGICTVTGEESTSIRMIKIDFNQKVTNNKPLYAIIQVDGPNVEFYGIQGGYLK